MPFPSQSISPNHLLLTLLYCVYTGFSNNIAPQTPNKNCWIKNVKTTPSFLCHDSVPYDFGAVHKLRNALGRGGLYGRDYGPYKKRYVINGCSLSSLSSNNPKNQENYVVRDIQPACKFPTAASNFHCRTILCIFTQILKHINEFQETL